MSATAPGTSEPASGDAAGTAARRARQQARRQGTPASGDQPTRSSAGAAAPVDTASVDPATPGRVHPAAHRRGGELDPDALAALEEERDFLLRSLDDLEREHDAGDVDDTDHQALKDDYTARAAAVIRAIESREAAFERARPPRRRGRTLAWVVGLLVVSIGLGVIVAQSSGRRDPGESVSGDIRRTNRDLLLEAGSLWTANPPDLLGAIALYDQVLADQPANTEALSYKAWLLYQTSTATEDPADSQVLLARANELLDDAVAIDPEYGDARIFRASVLGARGFPEQGLADLDVVRPGSVPEYMGALLEAQRSRLERQAATGSGSTVPTTVAPAAGAPTTLAP